MTTRGAGATAAASNEALVRKYADVAYAAQSNPLSHPDRLASVAALHGLEVPDLRTCRVLELGCNDGSNLLPTAATLPHATFVGCDLSPEAIALAQEAIAETGLGNVALFAGDLRALPDSLGPFDFVIAHGVYSWVPPDVRDGLLALANEKLTRNGLVFVSYNVYPGCHVRRAAWEVLRWHTRGVGAARERLDAARALAAALAEPGRLQNENDAPLRREFGRIAALSDSALYHDDLAVPNDPVYFRDFAEQARKHGLAFVSEAKLFNSSALGTAPRMQPYLIGGRLEREQYLDFACLRRFRQSVLCRAQREAAIAWSAERASGMHAAASLALIRAAAQGKPLVNPARPALTAGEAETLQAVHARLLHIAPRSLAVAELEAAIAPASSRRIATMLADAYVADEILLHVRPPPIAAIAGERPLASPVARWQARRGPSVTNLQHETLQLPDQAARALLALLDGRRDRQALAADMSTTLDGDDPSTRVQLVDRYVRQFARLGLLTA